MIAFLFLGFCLGLAEVKRTLSVIELFRVQLTLFMILIILYGPLHHCII